MNKRKIKNLSLATISQLIEEMGEKRHRKAQILQWLFQKGVDSFMEMTNLPLDLRKTLHDRFIITKLELADSVRSKEDTSQKFLLASDDGATFEAVLMESRGHQTICVSCQLGCPLGCTFCLTGQSGFVRNLRSDEILNQILFFKRGYIRPRQRFNIVFMGMGEPLLNMDNVSRALEIVNETDAFALREKRITLSTIGFPDKIIALSHSHLKFALAISLNATTDSLRKSIMPHACTIHETLDAAQRFAETRGTRVTLEYVLLAGVNDRGEDAERLVALTTKRPFKINLILFNEWNGSQFRTPSDERIDRFVQTLLPHAPAVTVRRSQGKDIDAACGLLRATGKKGKQ